MGESVVTRCPSRRPALAVILLVSASVLFSERQVAGDNNKAEAADGLQLGAGE